MLDRGEALSDEPRRPPVCSTRRSRDELAQVPLLPTEDGAELTLAEAVLPPALLDEDGEAFRSVLGEDAAWDDRRFPAARLLRRPVGQDRRRPRRARAVAGREPQRVWRAATIRRGRPRSTTSPAGSSSTRCSSSATTLWHAHDGRRPGGARGAGAPASRCSPCTATTTARSTASSLGDTPAFFPPQSARQDLPLQDLRFMCHAVCWGALNKKERAELLDERMKAWASLFDVREFRFETVVQAAVLPALVLKPDARRSSGSRRSATTRPSRPICQLAGRFAKPDRPLRYQRLQSDRALQPQPPAGPVPIARRRASGGFPPTASTSARTGSATTPSSASPRPCPTDCARDVRLPRRPGAVPRPPRRLRAAGDARTRAEDVDDEVDVDEDADQAIETNERDRWIAFLSWIGVNRAFGRCTSTTSRTTPPDG